jgi:hypothetical protein
MITAIVIGLLFLVSGIAAAGLIASAQNSADAARAMAGLETNPEVEV